jgi:putative ABC transport system ATP-binding protein
MTTLLEARDLFRFFHAGDSETVALRGVSVRVDAGEMVAVAGPSGSGKSTLLACLAGLDDPDGGMVAVAGHQMSRRPEPEKAAIRSRHLGMLFQSNNLIEHLTVRQNMALVQRMASRPDPARIELLLADTGLAARADALPSQLSGGETARAGLAVALANDPAVVLADEPTGEVDRSIEDRIMSLLRARTDSGGAVIVVTHSDAVSAAADRVVHLLDGMVTP